MLKWFETHALYFNFRVTISRPKLRVQQMNENILVICVSILYITEMKDIVLTIVLPVTRRGQSHCIRHVDLRSHGFKLCICDAGRSDFKCAISHLQVAYIGVGKTDTM